MDFGGNAPGDDKASLLSASWRETRRMVLNYGSISQFNFRQFLFARQVRLPLVPSNLNAVEHPVQGRAIQSSACHVLPILLPILTATWPGS